jgi:hypothetical protein
LNVFEGAEQWLQRDWHNQAPSWRLTQAAITGLSDSQARERR